MDQRLNHQLYLVKCPAGCEKYGESLPKGMGLHPDDASICKSAIIDNSVPVIGGIVGVATYIGNIYIYI